MENNYLDLVKKGDKVALVIFKNTGYCDIDSGLTFGETKQLEEAGIKIRVVKNLVEYTQNKFGIRI